VFAPVPVEAINSLVEMERYLFEPPNSVVGRSTLMFAPEEVLETNCKDCESMVAAPEDDACTE
jgi:hypothetical protein